MQEPCAHFVSVVTDHCWISCWSQSKWLIRDLGCPVDGMKAVRKNHGCSVKRNLHTFIAWLKLSLQILHFYVKYLVNAALMSCSSHGQTISQKLNSYLIRLSPFEMLTRSNDRKDQYCGFFNLTSDQIKKEKNLDKIDWLVVNLSHAKLINYLMKVLWWPIMQFLQGSYNGKDVMVKKK